MTFSIKYEARVDDDIEDALEYYHPISPNLAADFLDQIEIAKNKILLNPQGFEIKYKEIRTVLLEQFPYHIYFILYEDLITVLAILHAQSGGEKIDKITN